MDACRFERGRGYVKDDDHLFAGCQAGQAPGARTASTGQAGGFVLVMLDWASLSYCMHAQYWIGAQCLPGWLSWMPGGCQLYGFVMVNACVCELMHTIA